MAVKEADLKAVQPILNISKPVQILLTELSSVVAFVQSIALGIYEWIRMWWILLPMKGPFDKIPLVWNLVAHHAIESAGPELDYNVGVFNAIDGLFFQLKRHKVFKGYLGFTPFVTVASAEGTAKILTDTSNISKSILYDMIKPWMGNGLLTGSGPSYRMRRKLMTPAFHFKARDNLLPIFEKHVAVFCSKLKGTVDILALAQVLGLDIITETAMGIELNAQLEPNEPYVRAVHRATQAHMARTTRPWLWNDFIFYLSSQGRQFRNALKEMKEFVNKVVDRRLAILKARPYEACQSFIDTLITMHFNHPTELKFAEVIDEVQTFMFAGHDTTAVAVAFSLYLIGLHPEVQQRVHDEVDRVFPDSDDSVTAERLRDLRYLEATIKEVLRLYPSAPVIARRVDTDIELHGYTIPRGATVNLFSYGLHRDPENFPEPLEFRPERFYRDDSDPGAGETYRQIPPFAYFPFSGGMRNCVGQKFAMSEMKTVLSQVLRKFRLRSLHKRDELELAIEVIIRPRKGLLVEFVPRNI